MSAVELLGQFTRNAGQTAELFYGDDIEGVVHVFDTTTARDLIPIATFRNGELCRVRSPNAWYELSGGSWVAYTGFGGGGLSGIPMTFFASTTDGDPTAGGVRLNHATPASATSLFVDDVEAGDGTNIRDLIAALGNVIGAQVRLQSKSADENWIVYRVGGYTSASGYGKLTGLTVVDSSATVTLSTTAGDTILSIDVGVPKDLANQGLTGAKSVSYNGEVDNATTTIDFTTGALQKKTLGANTTLATPTPPPAFTWVQMRFIQHASTGPYTLAFWGGIQWDGPTPTMPTTASAELVVGGYYDGSAWHLGTGRPPVAAGLEYNASNQIILSTTLPARGQENVAVDAYPPVHAQGTVNTGGNVTLDYLLAVGKRAKVACDVWVEDGAGACLFAKALAVVAHVVGGAAVVILQDATHDNLGSGFTLVATASGLNVRFTLANTSGTNRIYNAVAGAVTMDKP